MSTLSVSTPVKAGGLARLAIGLLLAANVARILTDGQAQAHLVWYAALMSMFLVLFALVMWRSTLPARLLHVYFGVQCVLIVLMLAPEPEVDTVTAFFIALAFQAPLVFRDRALWTWVSIFVALTAGSLALGLGLLPGLAFALPPIAVMLVVPTFMLLNQGTELARAGSQALLGELEERHGEIEGRAAKAEELAALQERNRLARELHDRVSQSIFGIVLTSQSARLLLRKDPVRVRGELARLQELTAEALGQLRAMISEMRP